jgi:DNA mismatch endonuclease (patch repair protein)
MDRLTPEKRSSLMSRIRSKDTKPELEVRSALHRLGYRYALHKRDLPGTPDLVFTSKRKIIFVHGCYWHGHTCKYGRAQSKSNTDFWEDKISRNQRRDRRILRELRAAGWSVATVWECSIKRGIWLDRIIKFLDQ